MFQLVAAATVVPLVTVVVVPAVSAAAVEGSTLIPRSVVFSGSSPEQSFISAVSCSSPTACTAVGDDLDAGAMKPEALRWNGTAWTKQDILSHGPNGTFLFGGVV